MSKALMLRQIKMETLHTAQWETKLILIKAWLDFYHYFKSF